MFRPLKRNWPKDLEALARMLGNIAFTQFMRQRIKYGDLSEDDGTTVCLN